MDHRLGLVSISFRKLSPRQIIDAVRENGLSVIEWGSDVHAPCSDKAAIDGIVRDMKESGVYCSSYGTYFRLGVTPISELEGHIAAAKALGTDILRIWCGNLGYSELTAEQKAHIQSEGRKAADVAKKHGVTLCLECHNGTYTDCVEGALEILGAVGSEHFQMYWQPNQFKSVESNIEYAKAVADRTKVIHVFNWEGKEKYPLSLATETWKKYLGCFSKDVILLLEFMPGGELYELSAETAALKEIAR